MFGAKRAASCRESENIRTFRPCSGTKAFFSALSSLRLGAWIWSWRVIRVWKGSSPLLVWSCTEERPKEACSRQTTQGRNSPGKDFSVLPFGFSPSFRDRFFLRKTWRVRGPNFGGSSRPVTRS